MTFRCREITILYTLLLSIAGCDGGSDRSPAINAGSGGASASGQAAVTEPATGAGCEPSGSLQYVCGPENSEDLLQLGTSRWLVASGMNGFVTGLDTSGHVYLVDHEAGTWEVLFPAASHAPRQDLELFGDCPGPIDAGNFSAHGLALKESGNGMYRLYMTSHGAREAVEVFELDATGDKPAITWVGCVLTPEKTWANSVAILADGGFVTTRFMDPTDPDAYSHIVEGAISGGVYEWHPGGTVELIPGTEMSGPNGILVSNDDRWMYVAAYGGREVVRFDRTGAEPVKTAGVPIHPDNLRWTAQGRILTVGANLGGSQECDTPPCDLGWSVYEIEPESMTAARVTGFYEAVTLAGASSAIQVGNEIWIGTYGGDRIGHMPRP